MKKSILKSVLFSALLTSFTSFGQATGTVEVTADIPVGIQNNSDAQNTRSGGGLNVLVVAAPGNPDWILDVEAKLEASGIFNVDTFLSSGGTPTIGELNVYDGLFVFTDAGAANPAALGDVLGQYMDAGGAVVDATFTPNIPITGGFTAYELYSLSGQSNGANLGFGTIADPGHPILSGVSTFDGGTASFHNTGGTLAAGATVIAEYSTGAPLIIIDDNVGPANVRRTFLNFYPPSIDARDDFWNTTSDGALIMQNALEWTITGSVLSTNDNELGLAISVYPNPANNQLTIDNKSGVTIESTHIMDMLGRVVITLDSSEAVNRTIDISSLNSGMYFLNMESTKGSSSIKFIKK